MKKRKMVRSGGGKGKTRSRFLWGKEKHYPCSHEGYGLKGL